MCLKVADAMANSVDSDQTSSEEQSDLGLHSFLRPISAHTWNFNGS